MKLTTFVSLTSRTNLFRTNCNFEKLFDESFEKYVWITTAGIFEEQQLIQSEVFT